MGTRIGLLKIPVLISLVLCLVLYILALRSILSVLSCVTDVGSVVAFCLQTNIIIIINMALRGHGICLEFKDTSH